MKEALELQRTTSMFVFGNSDGQPYTPSDWNTNLRRLTEFARKKAEKEGIEFARFMLKDMRLAAVTDRVDEGDKMITNATRQQRRPHGEAGLRQSEEEGGPCDGIIRGMWLP